MHLHKGERSDDVEPESGTGTRSAEHRTAAGDAAADRQDQDSPQSRHVRQTEGGILEGCAVW